jgi:hypothetical protein
VFPPPWAQLRPVPHPERLRPLLVLAWLLWLLALTLPWAGWQGLRCAAPLSAALALLLDVALLLHPAPARPGWLRASAAAAGLGSAAWFAWRLAVAPANPLLAAWRSAPALACGLVASLLAGALPLALRRSPGVGASLRIPALATRVELAAVWRALWSSRAVVWTGGLLGAGVVGLDPSLRVRPLVDAPFGAAGNLLVAPASAWDATSYLGISQVGYGHSPAYLAFFPLYPSLLRAAAFTPQAALVGGVLLSLGAFAVALLVLRRLCALELGAATAELTIRLVAFAPMAVFFSAIYTESLFLALSAGSFLAARRERPALAGALAGLAAFTRSTGIALLPALLVLRLYGPRERPARQTRSRWRPRHRPDSGLLWLGLVPLGTLAFLLLAAAHGSALDPLRAQREYFSRGFSPLGGALRSLPGAVASIHQLLVGGGRRILPTPPFGPLADPLTLARADLVDVSFLAFALLATVGTIRRLPAAYGVYTVAMLALTLSSYEPSEPLASFPRYLLVVFPCQMWLATWARTRWRRRLALGVSTVLLAVFALAFASWRWVA